MNKKLTATESRVLQLIAEQKKSKEIAEILFVSEKTIRNHRYNIKKKLDLPNENNSLLKWAILNFK
jgi:DNA-binding CsgD family transcriptional regulator